MTGPTGSGKTTTLYSAINYLNHPHVSIITAEDPVEYMVDGITQCSINPKIGLTFDETLKHIVRQDPDIIVIGEIRDNFSAETAIEAALTGHKGFDHVSHRRQYRRPGAAHQHEHRTVPDFFNRECGDGAAACSKNLLSLRRRRTARAPISWRVLAMK